MKNQADFNRTTQIIVTGIAILVSTLLLAFTFASVYINEILPLIK